jgi:AraC-like DNA-binding protein
VRLARTVEEFLNCPVGGHYRGRAFAVWMPSASLLGATHFNRFDPADLPALRALFEIALHPALVPPYDLVHDLGGVDVIDRPAFDLHAMFLAQLMPRLAGRLRRLAVVRPPGLSGATYAGLFHDFSSGLGGRLFTTRDEAFAWLELDEPTRRDVGAIAEAFEMAAPILRRLRELLDGDPRSLTLEKAAGALGASPRSLQRHLADEQSSFRDELAQARIRVATRRLVETDDKIEVIAHELGFRSVPAFSTMFSRLIGEPPQQYRASRRGV